MKKLLIKCCLLLALVPCFNSCTSLHDAAMKGDVATVQRFISEGTNVNQVDKDGQTPLHLAARDGHTEVAKALIAAGVNVNLADNGDVTPLYWPVVMGRTEIVELLKQAGARK